MHAHTHAGGPAEPATSSQLLVDPQGKELLGVPITQPMVDLLCSIFHHTNDLNSSTANQIVRIWPAHCKQFGSFQTTMSEANREVLHIIDVKAIQHKISSSSKEKAQPAAAEDKVLVGQAAIKNGAVAESNSAVIDLAAFNV